MTEYIDRERVLANATFVHGQWDDTYISAEKIKEIPAADVAPVVRCEDCKHRIYKHVNSWIGEIGGCNIFDHPMPNNAFCSYGERKDEANES